MISVIVSIYNIENYLKECVDSLLSQDYKDFEIILVDDGSTDSSGIICDKYQDAYSNVRVIHKRNGGLVSARKSGLLSSSGTHIIFLDGDDYLDKNCIATFSRYIKKHNPDIICASLTKVYPDGNTEKVPQYINNGLYKGDSLERVIIPNMLSTHRFFTFGIIPSVCTKCFKRDIILDAYSTMDDRITIGEDAAISYPSILKSNSILVVDYAGYMYRQNPNSMTHTYDDNLYKKLDYLLNRLDDEFNGTHYINLKKQFYDYAFALLINGAKNEFKYSKYAIKVKKAKFSEYLNNQYFKQAIIDVNLNGISNMFIRFAIKHRFFILLNIIYYFI